MNLESMIAEVIPTMLWAWILLVYSFSTTIGTKISSMVVQSGKERRKRQ